MSVEKDIDIEGLNVHYAESGPADGQPVILLHGWGCKHETLASIESNLSKRMHVYALDLAGHGLSDEPKTVWGTSDFAGQLQKFISSLKIENPVLLGHSFGGRVSIFYAANNPVKKLLLVDSAGIKAPMTLKKFFKIYSYKTIKRLLPILFGKEMGGRMIAKYRKRVGSADYNNASPMMKAVMSKCVNEDLTYLMPKIKAPTLLVWGKNDTATPLSDACKMEKHIPDAGIVAFDDCGHYSFLDNPFGFKSVVNVFLKDELS